MSAHRLYCYAPQREVVVEFLNGLGAIISRDSPHAITDQIQLQGLTHITFIVVDHHPARIPQRMWDRIVVQGAVVIHIDDQFKRERAGGRVLRVHHYPADAPQPGSEA